MPEQMLRIEPEHELKFTGPFTTPTTSFLKLSNPSERRICFKIKTTAPKRYCVRPNAGILEPGDSLSIAVVFQPCELEPTANKHKFMVQSIFAPDGEINADQLWKDVDVSKIMDTKLRCSFEIPAESQNNQNGKTKTLQEEKFKRSKNEEVSKPPKQDRISEENIPSRGGSDVTQLKQQNSELREEVERLMRQLKSRDLSGNVAMGANASPPTFPMLYIVLALVAVLVGLILGKFIL